MEADSLSDTMLRCVLICGGGSGGHLTPGVAVAEELYRRNSACRIVFLTSHRSVDLKLPKLIRIPPERLIVSSLRIPPAGDAFRRPWLFFPLMIAALLRAGFTMIRWWPDCVIGLGGIASVPGVLIGWLFRRRTVLMEQNTTVGAANHWLSRFASVLCTGLPLDSEFPCRRGLRIVQTGIPLRSAFTTGQVNSERPDSGLRILILGGSQGASRLNQLAASALCSTTEVAKWAILHQTGESDREAVQETYQRQAINAEVTSFIEDVSAEMRRSSIVISRAGATTIAELCATETPAILIPLKTAARDHQVRNAKWYSSISGLEWIDEGSPDAQQQLKQLLSEITCNSEWQAYIHGRLSNCDHRDATANVIGELLNVKK